MTKSCVFRQWTGDVSAAGAADAAESYVLRSLDPEGEAAQLAFDGTFSGLAGAGFHDYAGNCVQDSGPFDGAAPIIMLVAFNVPDALKEEVDRWYVEEHVPLLMKAPGWHRARRFEVTGMADGTRPFTSLAFHQLADVSVLDSKERAFARNTQWRADLENNGTWFGEAGRWIYECV